MYPTEVIDFPWFKGNQAGSFSSVLFMWMTLENVELV